MQPWRRTTNRHAGNAFTLVEMLVSTAVLALLLVLLGQVASMVGNTWSQGQSRNERRQNARALADFIGRELSAAALPADVRVSATMPNLQFVLNPASVPEELRQPHALFWQAPLATEASAGDMAILGYFVRWDSGAVIPRASLCRVFLNPGDPNHLIYHPDHLNDWVNASLLAEVAPADTAHAYRGLFAENVIGFWARCLDGTGASITNTSWGGFDSRQRYTATGADGASITRTAPVLPSSVEVSLVVLDSRSARKLTRTMQAIIMPLVKSARDADHCLTLLQGNPVCRPILPGASACQLRVYLENGP